MTTNGDRPTLHGRWPTGHSGWLFEGMAQFEGRITSFLAEGAARGERLMFVADDPEPKLWPSKLVERGELVVASTAEIYGPERMVTPASQRQTFAMAMAEALAKGYSGLRIAADNTQPHRRARAPRSVDAVGTRRRCFHVGEPGHGSLRF
jgi:MEDS: MEthanogen/methylotroph, DcmR Sensory domain